MLELAKIKYDSMTLDEMSDILSAHLQLKIVTNSYLKKVSNVITNFLYINLVDNLNISRFNLTFKLA